MSRFKSKPGLQQRSRQVSYHELGALDHSWCDDPRLVAAWVRLMENSPRANPTFNPERTFLVLGLQRERARSSAPHVIADYRLLEDDAIAAAVRSFSCRILGAIAPSLANQ